MFKRRGDLGRLDGCNSRMIATEPGSIPNRALKKSASLAAFPLPEKSISNKRFKPAAVPV